MVLPLRGELPRSRRNDDFSGACQSITPRSSAGGDTGRRPVASKLTFTFLRRIATSECACPCTVHSNPCTSRPPGQLVRLMRIHHHILPHSSRNMRQQHKPPTNPHLQIKRDHIEDLPILRSPLPNRIHPEHRMHTIMVPQHQNHPERLLTLELSQPLQRLIITTYRNIPQTHQCRTI